MSGLRLDLIVRTYTKPGLDIGGKGQDRWSWRLWSGSRIVATSGSQLYSRRIDCARGAEVGAGLSAIVDGLREFPEGFFGYRHQRASSALVAVHILDERERKP